MILQDGQREECNDAHATTSSTPLLPVMQTLMIQLAMIQKHGTTKKVS